MQIFCFGDSIAYGAWETEGGWVDRLKRSAIQFVQTHPGQYREVYNLGIPGDKTDGLVERFANETNQRVAGYKGENIFLFSFGANDAAFSLNANEFRCPIEKFESNYRLVLGEAKKFSDRLYVLSITPVDEALCNSGDSVRMNTYIEQYNQALKKIATEESVTVIDVNAAFHEIGYQSLLGPDGIHPNTQGYELMYELVKRSVLPV